MTWINVEPVELTAALGELLSLNDGAWLSAVRRIMHSWAEWHPLVGCTHGFYSRSIRRVR
jgi:hypothetical protein